MISALCFRGFPHAGEQFLHVLALPVGVSPLLGDPALDVLCGLKQLPRLVRRHVFGGERGQRVYGLFLGILRDAFVPPVHLLARRLFVRL